MIIHNATFMLRKELEEDVLLWLKGMMCAMDLGAGSNPRISAMREAGGVSHHHADAASIAFQVEFPSIEQAKEWAAGPFEELSERFTARYGGEESMVFTSLFEVI